MIQPPFPQSLSPDGGKGIHCTTVVSAPFGGRMSEGQEGGWIKKVDFYKYLIPEKQ
jgi:hypothetical protein